MDDSMQWLFRYNCYQSIYTMDDRKRDSHALFIAFKGVFVDLSCPLLQRT